MKIIDAHFHVFPAEAFPPDALREIGHEPGMAHLVDYYAKHDFVHGVIMGNRSLDPADHQYPALFHYCIGLDAFTLRQQDVEQALPLLEENLRREQCCGVKLYPGYNSTAITDPCYEPVYRLAEQYRKPVAIHMGQTAHPAALLKYAHPLNLDEVAVKHPYVQFVMCHFGNPFLPDAAAVAEKNPNVAVDLSGLLEGFTDLERYQREQAGYLFMLRGWIAYVNDWSKFMFGTDFPAVNLQNYADFAKLLVPEEHWQEFFFGNANRIYGLGL